MSTIVDYTRVHYLCGCERGGPLVRLFFCRHCSKLRCGTCALQEVDSYFCPNCLDRMRASEAKLRKNRCTNCYNCPQCLNTLSVRACSVPASETDKTPKKLYGLVCPVCQWTSADSNIPAQTVPTGQWPINHPDNENTIYKKLLEHYTLVASREKADAGNWRRKGRGFLYLTGEKYKSFVRTAKRRTASSLALQDTPLPESPQVDILDEFAELDESVFTSTTLNTSLGQRHANVSHQWESSDEMLPLPKILVARYSQRCRECEHNLCKPDDKLDSLNFRIQLNAYYHVPEIRIKSIPPLQVANETKLTLTLTNPRDHIMHTVLLPAANCGQQEAKLMLPTCELTLAGYDETAEFAGGLSGETNSADLFDDDTNVVIGRHGNKLTFQIPVIPRCATENCVVTFRLRYEYHNIYLGLPSEQAKSKKDNIVWLESFVSLKLGAVQEID